VPATGGVARRLTTNLGISSHPALSPDGRQVAFIGREEGEAEVYVMPTAGGLARRLTYLGSFTMVLGWTPGGRIVIASDAGQPFSSLTMLYTVEPESGELERLPYGPAQAVSFGPAGQVVLGRRAADNARWKRYRGGQMGDIWIDPAGQGNFKRLLKKLNGNLVSPMWLGGRIYFLSDHEGISNIYSCTPQGKDLQRHTHHEPFYVRQPDTDGQRIVYRVGADLFLFDPAREGAGESVVQPIRIDYHSPRVQRNRKFVNAEEYLEYYRLHPAGHSLALTVRGHAFAMANWDGATFQYGQSRGVRYRLPEWLNDGKRLVMLSDASGEEVLEIHPDASLPAMDSKLERLEGLDLGRALALKLSPRADALVLTNHRLELIYVDLAAKTSKVLDRSKHGQLSGIDWSLDGKWVAYGFPTSHHTGAIKLCRVETGETTFVTPPNTFYDYGPSFDPDGRYLYFISHREFDPVYDRHYFDLNFPLGSRPYLVTLQADLPNPFMIMPPNLSAGESGKNGGDSSEGKEGEEKPEQAGKSDKEQKKEKMVQIDFEGLQQRVSAFPVSESRYAQIRGAKDKVYFTSFPLEGSLSGETWRSSGPPPGKGVLEQYDLVERKKEFIAGGLNGFELSRGRQWLVYQSGKSLRVLKVGEKPDNNAGGFNKKSGWVRLSRLTVEVSPPKEWLQMFREAWRLQRDHFWTEDMSSVDWQEVYRRYQPLLDRVSSRAEFSDLLWEMQGELGTSHAYELGGDYRPTPRYRQGSLGADFEYEPASNGYRVSHVVRGDPWIRRADSPLNRMGVNVREGDLLLAIDGRRLDRTLSPAQALINRANTEVQLTVLSADGAAGEVPKPRIVLVRTLAGETQARYREWVEANRRRVHEATDGRVGYVHIPNMGPHGYAEFHRYYLAEAERQGLVVDVRFNGGGHVSQLLIEKLARQRLGYRQPRYGEIYTYPAHTVIGPMVAVTNEFAGSDGDIFSHVFKLTGLGPLIGKRTWGGVVGISPRHALVDGTVTTQPEFSTWFDDVGWGIENYGTDPDIEVEIKPQDYAKGEDPQLDRAIKEVLKRLEEHPPQLPNFEPRPRLDLPSLPKARPRK
jgi:tricorn protease